MRRLGKAKSSRSAIHAHRDESKQIQASLLDERKNAAKIERANDHAARDAKEGIVQANRAACAKQQATRYVPALEVESLLSHPDASDTFRRVFGLGGRQGKVILPLPLPLYTPTPLPLPLPLT